MVECLHMTYDHIIYLFVMLWSRKMSAKSVSAKRRKSIKGRHPALYLEVLKSSPRLNAMFYREPKLPGLENGGGFQYQPGSREK